MAKYYVNKKAQSDGYHEVHTSDCDELPDDKKELGYFNNCKDAVTEAKKTYSKSDGCYYCCRECHTR